MKRIAMGRWLSADLWGTCLVLATAGFGAGCSSVQTSHTQVATVQHGQPASPGIHAAPAVQGLTARQAWERLVAGNARFVNGRPEHPEQSVMRRAEVARGQHPYAIVLCCADSRVPPEIIFDAGLGDIFVVRVAGNTADDGAIGSIEYAAEHLHVPLIVVLGHERCGAVQAAVETVEKNGRPKGHLGAILSPIVPAVHAVKGQDGDVPENVMQENVLRTVRQLRSSKPVLARMIDRHSIAIVGARYDLDTGKATTVDMPEDRPVPVRTPVGMVVH